MPKPKTKKPDFEIVEPSETIVRLLSPHGGLIDEYTFSVAEEDNLITVELNCGDKKRFTDTQAEALANELLNCVKLARE